MRKGIIFVMMVLLAFSAGSAYAQGMGYGGGKGPGGGMGGAGVPGQGMNLPANFKPVTQEQANKISADYIAANLKGYNVVSSEVFQGMRYTGYSYTIQDASGNQFNLIVNARGDVRGPIPVKK